MMNDNLIVNEIHKTRSRMSFMVYMEFWTSFHLLYPLFPSYFQSAPRNVIDICRTLSKPLKREFEAITTDLILSSDHILDQSSTFSIPSVLCGKGQDTYIKSRLNSQFCDMFYDVLNLMIPFQFSIQNMNNMPIVFYNKEESLCETHFDRDSSVLMVLEGQKEIMLAEQSIVTSNYGHLYYITSQSGIHSQILPFDEDKETRLRNGWISVTIHENDCIYIPKGVLHSIKSVKETVAISFQVKCVRTHKLAKCYSTNLIDSFETYLHRYYSN